MGTRYTKLYDQYELHKKGEVAEDPRRHLETGQHYDICLTLCSAASLYCLAVSSTVDQAFTSALASIKLEVEGGGEKAAGADEGLDEGAE